MSQEIEGVYLSKVTIKDFNCFRGEQTISFTRPDGRYQQWNVILGNNNTGKTTILRLLSGLSISREMYKIHNEILPAGAFSDKYLHEYFSQQHEFTVKSNLQYFKKHILKNALWGYKQESNLMVKYALCNDEHLGFISLLMIQGYGTSRKMSPSNLSETYIDNAIGGLFQDNYELINAEEWLLQLDYGAKNGIKNAEIVLNKLKTVLTSGLLPDVKAIELKSELNPETNSIKNYALFETDYGNVRLKDLGYGYQATMAWVVDLAKKLFERYASLENPLTGAAIVLVDEIDLHLHPDWQRQVISHLSSIFPNVQFIVTAHSPLIVQSADNVNLIILEKGKDNQTHIRQEFGTFKGWTVEEILQDLMGLGDKTLSDTYLNLLQQFEDGLDSDNYEKAKAAYDELLLILHPQSSQRKLLKLQLGAIAPTTV
ncbi:AAA family ATPase [Runella aurantiaca]|uniref:ATPase AAA-type core domain-containing protein n=1 Tax=Runella aurantiaca TaxID=2282308 RepID=A0A369IB44_9BACT|nr:AAA family ATPase [Runella aurantiaca]RDB06959.1 hypothetical protein DVG78_06685 [Runella aurantiaca]